MLAQTFQWNYQKQQQLEMFYQANPKRLWK